jgi:hypothetical protein
MSDQIAGATKRALGTGGLTVIRRPVSKITSGHGTRNNGAARA